jgi:phospholipase C
LQFLEKITGVPEPNISPWRRQTFGDLTATLRLADSATPAVPLPDTAGPLVRAKFDAARLPLPTLPGAQEAPHQEPGARRRVPGTGNGPE